MVLIWPRLSTGCPASTRRRTRPRWWCVTWETPWREEPRSVITWLIRPQSGYLERIRCAAGGSDHRGFTDEDQLDRNERKQTEELTVRRQTAALDLNKKFIPKISLLQNQNFMYQLMSYLMRWIIYELWRHQTNMFPIGLEMRHVTQDFNIL